MPKRTRELTPAAVRRLAEKPGFHAVGGVAGLYLQVKRPPAASWILRVKMGDKRPDLGLGAYPTVTLADARDKARRYREQIEQGIDPREARRAAQAALVSAEAKRLTFDQAAEACFKARSREFRNAKHAKQWKGSLDTYASPKIGALPVSDVELAHVVSVLEPHWLTKTESMSRLRGRIETVLEWARVSGYRDGLDNPAAWKTLKHVLPSPSKVSKGTHYPALPWHEVPRFMAGLRERDGMGARALEFVILTAARSGEVRLATWDEIDIEGKLWTVPTERMKAGLTHRVPLSAPAVKLLKKLPRMKGSPYVFPAARGGALSDMTLSAVPRRMHDDDIEAGGDGYLDPKLNRIATPHGFRSSFKDWCRSSTSYPDEVSELALAHVSSDATRAAYARDELLPKRVKLMNAWARFLATVPSKASVTPIRKRR